MNTCLLTTTNTRDLFGSEAGFRNTRYSSPRFKASPDSEGHPLLLSPFVSQTGLVFRDHGDRVHPGRSPKCTHVPPFRSVPTGCRSSRRFDPAPCVKNQKVLWRSCFSYHDCTTKLVDAVVTCGAYSWRARIESTVCARPSLAHNGGRGPSRITGQWPSGICWVCTNMVRACEFYAPAARQRTTIALSSFCFR